MMKIKKLIKNTFLFISLLSVSGLSFASPQKEDLKKNVEDYVLQQLKPFGNKAEVSEIRIPEHIKECSHPLKLSLNNTQRLIGSILVNAKCDTPSWQMFISVQTKVFAQIVVAGRPINANATITVDDLLLQSIDLSRQSGNVLLKTDQAINRIAKQNIASGQIIRPEQLKSKALIERGDKIKIILESNQFNMSSEGIAQTSGGIGEKIKLKVQSGKIIDGIVKDKHTAIVDF